jgi:ATP-binding cassette subfamily B protein
MTEAGKTNTAAAGQAEVPDDELAFAFAGDKRAEAGGAISTRAMTRRLPQLIRRALALAWKVNPRAAIALLVCQAASGVLEAFGLLATTGTITALVSSGNIGDRLVQAWPSLLMLASAVGLRALLAIAITFLSTRISPRISREAELMLLDSSTNAELAAYDNPGFNDRWDAADRGVEVSQTLLSESQSVLAALASLIAAAGVLTSIHPALLPLLVLSALPQGIASVRGARIGYLSSLATSKDRRVLSLLRWYLVDRQVADQVRSGTIAPYLLAKYRRIGARVDAKTDQAAWQTAKVSLLGALAGGITSGLVWGALAVLMASGHMSVAAAGTAVLALRTLVASLHGIVGYGARLFRTGLYLDDWADFVDEAGGHRLNRGTLIPTAPTVVRAENLTFSYPEAERPALTEVALEVRRGEVLALVGENGSGKTTLSKLLSALYLPDEGSVRWDEHDTRDLDPYAAWQQIAVVPQDYARWPLSFRENIHLGQPRPEGDAAVHAAAQASGADEVINDLPRGLATLLAREWWGGKDLSGGQWQRVAIARAFHRPAGLLVLDEPTAALDPRAEHRIFTGLRQLAADRAVVLVTHRLTNVAVADRIAVLDKGRVIQHGTFAELVQAPGLFRELWELENDRPAAGIPAPAPSPDTEVPQTTVLF